MSSRSFNPEPKDSDSTDEEEDVHEDTLRMSQSDLLAAMVEDEDRARYESSLPPPADTTSGVHLIPGRHDAIPPPPGEYRAVKVGR